MKWIGKSVAVLMGVLFLLTLAIYSPSTAMAAKGDKKVEKAEKAIPGSMEEKVPKVNAAFDVNKMGDMSDFDPSNPVIPTVDTIKIALVAPFSGAAAFVGEVYWGSVQWVAHDINKRGGIWVDGKKKLIEVIKADHMSKPDQAKKISERMVLQEKVHVLLGTAGTNNMKVMMEVGNKYKVIVHNFDALSDELMDATGFSRYAFMSTYSTEAIGRGLAYYYGQIRKKEKKFYILCQDYSYGHSMADGFKKGLKEYYPEAQIVGEDYHKLFLTDFAPYVTKVKASGAEVVYTGDWMPDLGNLIKQSRQMGITIPFADRVMDDANSLSELGVESTKGLVNLTQSEYIGPEFRTPDQIKYNDTWHKLWQTKWTKPPYNSNFLAYPDGQRAATQMQVYWLLSVIERAKSTDPDKIIKVWENDSYRTLSGKVLKMRACDHKVIQDLVVNEFVPPDQQKVSYNKPPYYWFKDCSYTGYHYVIPAAKILPWMDQKLDRCAGKNDWGE
jgi:ABC-type branched-subunit amino acid transport system substrate-binding protein